MSGIAGILHVDGRPARLEDVQAMTAAMAHRGPDGHGEWVGGGVALGHCLLATTPESVGEHQPCVDHGGEVCLIFDGRLDNRDELLGQVGPERPPAPGVTDAEIVLHSYLRWGREMVPRLLGDFALAVWDARRRELLCARDYLGKRPFFYSFDGRRFRFASEPQVVLLDRTIPRTINEAMVGEFLASDVCSRSETVFTHLLRLPAAHTLTVGTRGVSLRRYWQWDPDREVRFDSDAEYAACLLDLLKQSVRAHMRVLGPLAADLSGGLDSSSVVAVVEALRRDGLDIAFETYSQVFPGWTCDESEYIHAVVDYWGLPSHLQVHRPVPEAEYLQDTERYLDVSDDPNALIGNDHRRVVRDRGSLTVLTGRGGDAWFTGNRYAMADFVRGGKIRVMVVALRPDVTSGGYLDASRRLWHYGLRPLVPARARRVVGRAIGRHRSPPWITTTFRRRIDLDDRIKPSIPQAGTYASRYMSRYLDDGWVARQNELVDRSAAWLRQDVRDPLEDRRLAEFGLALPEEQRSKYRTTSKYVLREATVGLLPDKVRLRSTKAEFSQMFYEDLRLQGGAALYRDLAVARGGFVDGRAVSAMADALFAEGWTQHRVRPLWDILAVDRWYRSVS